jgi:hypothetical protein
MSLLRRFPAAAIAAAFLVTACSSDSTGPSAPQPVLGFSVTATGSASVRITFSGRAGESYEVERAEGAAGTFAVARTVAVLAVDGVQNVDDTGLKVTTAYRYRVTTIKGTQRSAPTAEATTTTLAFGSATSDITGDITTSRTLFADTAYTIKGFIHVANGATLTIQPGTIIKGDFNTLGSSLIVLRGARIQAVGTAEAPIVFTSSRAAGSRQTGDWGGLIIVGNAPVNRSGTVNIEGSGTDGTAVVSGKNYTVQYSGGTVATDNSGTLAYVRVEFAGYAPLQDNEFNAFTFAAVGSGTRASYLQSLGGLDDAFEFFGGGFDLDHLVALETGDDMFDMSEGFSGRIQFAIGQSTVQLTPRTGAGSFATDLQGIENDGCNGTGCDLGFDSTPLNIPLVANFTLIGCGQASCVGAGGGHGMMLRRGTGGYYVNSVIARWPTDGISLRDVATYTRAGSTATPANTANLQIRNVLFAEVSDKAFQAASATQNVLDLAANSLTLSTSTAAALFTALPAVGSAPTSIAAFDWTPVTGSAIATGGMTTFTGAVATKAGTFVTGTAYLGAVAPGGTKWWQGWTNYARN